MWYVHLHTIEKMKEDKPQQVRKYLTETKDFTALREWDSAQIKDS